MITRRHFSGFPLRRNAVWNAFLVSVLVLSCRHCSGAISAAFIDFDKSTAGSLLESRLLANDSYQWVERGQIDQIVKEQKTQALFSAAGVVDRSALGRALKADVLILLRTAVVAAGERSNEKKATRQVDLVICETRRGLRLSHHSLPAPESDGDAALVDRLESWAKEALQRADRIAVDACAVPAFVSNDLSFARDYLKRAYASVVEQAVFLHGRFAVVELAEAEALSKELTLAGEGASFDRRPPLYFWGDYRHAGQPDSPHVQLNLRLMRGKQVISAAERDNLTAADVPAFLQRMTLEMLSNVAGEQVVLEQPGVEARQLADRAREFISLGNIEEAMPLLEASLLLQPDDHDVRREAVIVGGKMGQRFFLYRREDPSLALPAIHQYRRALDHLETWLSANANAPEGRRGSGKRTFVDEFPVVSFLLQKAPTNAELKPAYDKLVVDLRETLLRLTRMRSRQNAPDAYRYLTDATFGLTPRERFGLVGKIALELQELPGAQQRTKEFVRSYYTVDRLNEPGGAELLAELASAGNAEIRTAVEGIRQELERYKPWPQTTIKDTFHGEPKLPLGPTKVTLTPVSFEIDGRSQKLPAFGGCLPAGPGVDVFWSDRRLFVMKEPGRLRKVWEGTELNDRFRSVSDGGQYLGSYVSFDGRYVWAAVSRLRLPPQLLVLDPVAESIREITADDGLPLAAANQQHLAVTGLEPGRACVAGSFGHSWIALVNLDSPRGRQVKVIQECRRTADAVAEEQWRQTDIAFDPTYVFALSDPKTGERRVLMGRGSPNHWLRYHPLLIDPSREEIAIFAEELPQFQSARGLALRDGSLYFVDHAFQEGQDTRLSRIGGPTWKREPILHHVTQGWVFFTGDQLHIVGKRWWSCRFPDGPLHVAAPDVPWHFANRWFYPGQTMNPEFNLKLPPDQSELENICPCNHYGLLVPTRRLDGRGYTFYQPRISSTSSQESVP